jgi:hypothetical protein
LISIPAAALAVFVADPKEARLWWLGAIVAYWMGIGLWLSYLDIQ